ncbi:MFS transporter [Microbacterium profundi]|uniref:MFS transporter n=1 Tax=Microbacterium profundi TaxID=450380 RepID=UPI001F410FFB|nr:MFS transporter [Microbacterium profundi]MCE7483575.1 MFS transporter [Microbacterium profundi]
MTFPGQTAGLSVFADPLIAQLGIDRSTLSLSYLIGTLLGAAVQPLIGRMLDRVDARRVIIAIAIVFAGILFALSFVQEIVGLTAGYVGLRMFGQGALGLAATTAVAQIVRRRRGLALGIGGAIGSAGISLAPVLLERIVSELGIAVAWRLESLAVLVVVIPIALTLPRPAPPETEAQYTSTGTIIVSGYTAPQARRTGMFWVLTGAMSTSAMLSTALGFHQIGLLGEQGLTPLEAAANFVPQTITALVATLLVGSLIDRRDPRIFIVGSMMAMAASMLLVPVVTPGIVAVIYGLVLGLAGGALRGMEAAAFVRYYGLSHIGSIRGVAISISLAASAFGPYALAIGSEWFGSFGAPSAWLAILPAVVAILALFVPQPTRN